MNSDSKREETSDKRSGSFQLHPSSLFLSSDVSSSPYAALAMAQSGGLLRSPPPFLGAPGLGTTPPAGDTSGLLAIYQSPLWQAAMRQQQLQLLSHIASMNNPFLSAQTASHPTPPFAGQVDPGHLYRDYLNKFSNTSGTPTSPVRPSTSSTTTTTPSAAAVALAANLMAVASGKTTSPDFPTSPTNVKTSSARYGQDKKESLLSTTSPYLLSGSSLDQRENNNGKLLRSPGDTKSDSPPSSVAPVTQTLISSGRMASHRNTSGRGRGRGGGFSSNDSYNGRDKVFTCKICNRSFGYKHVLQNHERTHTGEKPFECRVCHKRFTRDHHLKTHMRLHTGEKPYNCTHCDRQFVQVANLRRHLRVHTGEKPYKCDLCDASFSDSNQLKAHVLIHNGEKPFTCEKCEGKFRRRHHLMHHACPMTRNLDDVEYEEMESVTSPTSDSPRQDDFGLSAKKIRPLNSPSYDLEKKFLPGDYSTKGPSGLELSLMLAAAAASEKHNSPTSGSSARSRKSRDPKRVRPSADHSPKSEEDAKIFSSSFEPVSSEKHFERGGFQTEPEDLSNRRQERRDEDNEEEKENFDELEVSTSSDHVSATGPPGFSSGDSNPVMTKMPVINK